MSDDERLHWDERYSTGDYRARTRSTPFLDEWIPRIPTGRALVVACGPGRNAARLAEAGFDVVGVDISTVAIEQARANAAALGLDIEYRVADLDDFAPEPDAYGLITVIRYRNHALWPSLVSSLAPDGWIVAEHHMATPLDVAGPGSPDFRLAPGELLEAFARLRILHYSESIEPDDDGDRRYALQRAVACKGDPGW